MGDNGLMLDLRPGPDGLVPAVMQDATSGAVITLVWLDEAEVHRAADTGRVAYWSRGGELAEQHVREVRLDCDHDAVLLRVDMSGPGCGLTGAATCFHAEPPLLADDLPELLHPIDPNAEYDEIGG